MGILLVLWRWGLGLGLGLEVLRLPSPCVEFFSMNGFPGGRMQVLIIDIFLKMYILLKLDFMEVVCGPHKLVNISYV
jgi:hypothetical protein